MKKLLLYVAGLLLVNVSLQAQIPNYDLECWIFHAGPPSYEEPCGWATLNSNSQFGYPIFVYKTTDSQTDSFAIEVRTMGYTNPFPPFNALVDVGLARTSNDYQNGNSGFPYSQRPSMFSAWVKYAPQGVDSAEIKIKLYKWNVSQHYPQDVAEAKFYVSSNDASYHCVTKTFTYFAPFTTSGNPDTACVYISSSFPNNTTAGSIIKVDNISFGNCITGVKESTRYPYPHFYPNPADDMISFSSFPAGADRIKLFEITGKMVAVEAVSGSQVNVDIKMLNPGIYFYGVYDDNNKVISSGKFSVVR